MCTSENAWHCGASVSEKLSVGLNILKCFYETIHEQIEFCGDTEHIRIAQYAPYLHRCRKALSLRVWLRRFCLLSLSSGVSLAHLSLPSSLHHMISRMHNRRMYMVRQTDTRAIDIINDANKMCVHLYT